MILYQIVYVSFNLRTILTQGPRDTRQLQSVYWSFNLHTGLNLVLKFRWSKNLIVYCIGYALGILVGSKLKLLVDMLLSDNCKGRIVNWQIFLGIGDWVTCWFGRKDASRLVCCISWRKYERDCLKLWRRVPIRLYYLMSQSTLEAVSRLSNCSRSKISTCFWFRVRLCCVTCKL